MIMLQAPAVAKAFRFQVAAMTNDSPAISLIKTS